MPFLLLLALLTACLPQTWLEPAHPWGLEGSLAATPLVVLACWAWAAWISRSTVRRMLSEPTNSYAALRRYSRLRSAHGFGVILGYAACLGLLGWGWAVEQICSVNWDGHGVLVPGAEILVLLPFFVMLSGSWWFFHTVDRVAHGGQRAFGEDPPPFVGRVRYVAFHLRQQALLLVLPLGLMITRQGVDRAYPGSLDGTAARAAMMALVIGVVFAFPLALKPLLGLKRMPSGPTRERLTGHARQLRLRYRDLLVWDTHGGMANAMVVGFVPPARYVIFTDRLLSDLSDIEIDAVFGHEAGHVVHGHLLFYGCFLLLSMLAFSALWTASLPWLEGYVTDWGWLVGGQLTAMLVYFFLVFGFLSRRCERQADVFGCRVASHADGRLTPEGILAFISALENVSSSNGGRSGPRRPPAGGPLRRILRWARAWQHSTITQRVAFLRALIDDPSLERRFQRRLAALKWGVILALVGTVVGLGWAFGWESLVRAL